MLYDKTSFLNRANETANWLFINNALEKKYIFVDFASALAFINRVALIAENKHHHPEIFNLYNKVQLRLNTHDEDGVTDKDFDLAIAIDAIS